VVLAQSYEEAKELTSKNEYGNGAAVFARNGETGPDCAQSINIGMVGVHLPIPVPIAYQRV
tara:strand:+ start:3903 stop:4085 length:183 start_codon:yes stop_codon:yes gene_type:complete